MGFLKKITRPISKVLDKIVPNEIKPALPFLAAAAPFMAPGIMGIGGNTMLSRALISGGLNLGSQLAQEGSEGDFSPLSVALASGIGALSAPGTAGYGTSDVMVEGAQPSAAEFFKTKAAGMEPGLTKSGLGALEKSANYLTGAAETLTNNPFSMEGLKASIVPVTQATTDLAVAEARRTAKDLANDALASLPEGASDADRALAIRQFMEAAGYFSEDEIVDTITAAGYADGGRVRLRMGGSSDPDFSGIKGAMIAVDENMRADRAGDFFRLREEAIQKGDDDKIKEIESDFFKEFGMIMPKMAKDGGRIGFRDGSSTGSFGLDRYASEMLSEGKMLDKDATDFLNKYEDIVKEGKADERLFDLLKEYRTLEDKADKSLDKFSNTKLEDAAEGIMSVEDMKYYDKKMEDIDKKLDDSDKKLNTLEKEFSTKGIDASEITRTPDFQEWLELYKTDKSKAYDHPYADIYLGILGAKLKGRDKSFYETVPRAKDGGLMNLGGKEMDLRGGGFVPIGKKERADDVPARLSKNEFVMTADAVRGAGGGDINKGAKRMYETMNRLEARA